LIVTRLAASGEINIWMCIIEFAAKSKYPNGMTFVRFGSSTQPHK
jgi:hypothetical protein